MMTYRMTSEDKLLIIQSLVTEYDPNIPSTIKMKDDLRDLMKRINDSFISGKSFSMEELAISFMLPKESDLDL